MVIIAIALATQLGSALPASAQPVGLDPDALVAAEEDAYILYMKGTEAFEGERFRDAADAFQQAFETLPADREYGRSRGSLMLWQARCFGKLYEREGDTELLEKEAAILIRYRDRIGEVAKDQADREHKEALLEQRLSEIDNEKELRDSDQGDADTQLDKSLRGEYEGAHASTWRPDLIVDLGWYPRPDDPRVRMRQEKDDEVAPDRVDPVTPTDRPRPQGVGLLVGGGIALAGGVAGMAVMGVGMSRARQANDFDPLQSPMQRREQIAAGLDANTMAAVGAAVGSTLLLTGVIMTAVGARRLRRSKQRQTTLTVGPTGIGVRGRF